MNGTDTNRGIRCGNHSSPTYHPTTDDVRTCFAGGETRTWDDEIVERERAEEQRRDAAKWDRQFGQASGVRYATRKQVKFIRSLIAGKEIEEGDVQLTALLTALGNEDEEWGNDGDGNSGGVTPCTLPMSEVNGVLAWLKAKPARGRERGTRPTGPVSITEDGMYRDPKTGRIWKVQWNRASGDGRHLYAKQLVLTGGSAEAGLLRITEIPLEGKVHPDLAHSFQYAPGAMTEIRAEWRMTMDQAVAFGALYGTCIRCGATLTKETSIAQGMGDTCASYFRNE